MTPIRAPGARRGGLFTAEGFLRGGGVPVDDLLNFTLWITLKGRFSAGHRKNYNRKKPLVVQVFFFHAADLLSLRMVFPGLTSSSDADKNSPESTALADLCTVSNENIHRVFNSHEDQA
ncbi:MAG TPA: hypothetical protein VNM15_10735 [Candidatus Binatia bacterium]|nr:hypothetical protein [Candidatus Binatia bacterium]